MTMQNHVDLSVLGSKIFGQLSGGAIPTCALFGFYICALGISVNICSKKGFHSRSQKILYACMTLLSLCNVWHLGIQIETVLTMATALLSEHHSRKGELLARMCTVPLNINLVVGDAIVVWRTCNMWTEHKSLRYLLSTLMLGNLATNIADVLIDITTDAANHEIVMDYVSTSVSFVVNLMSTILIFIKACSRHIRVRRILSLLMESGVTFCFIQAIYVLVQILLYQNKTYSLTLWNLALVMVRNAAAVLYPLAVFIVVNLDQSMFNNRNSVPEPAFTTIIQGESLHSLEG
ncbi:hypothetical protein EV359DRAFT_62807 [Lentinula novae-zelandiae]|nr:hypothetical protein EV359DRAFT_62807 [Lentinula novae-zelandiae]